MNGFLTRHPFDGLDVTVRRYIQYGNQVLLVQTSNSTSEEILLIYSVLEEAKRALFWSDDCASRFIEECNPYEFSIDLFKSLYMSHFRMNPIFDKININDVISISAFDDPAYDDWDGAFYIVTSSKKYMLMWNYGT
ncbi:MAG: hypothetical protein HRU38_23665 [Saccharospirillaceae bacterium]|nr:hypothetical protein [Pseudomonadales bacterium]NRB81620.1 hypothetical protein [Saccharospirillaceae bacterium]